MSYEIDQQLYLHRATLPAHLDDNDRFLYHIRDSGLDQLHQDTNTSLGGGIDLDGRLANSPNGFSNKVHIYLRGVSGQGV